MATSTERRVCQNPSCPISLFEHTEGHGECVPASADESAEDWQRGDIVRDDTSNLFCYHNLHGWFGLASNQTSARGHYERHELCDPLTLLVRNGLAVSS